jgi:hypothetical protein
VATASNKPGSYSQSQLRAVLSAGIRQLEEDIDVLIVKQPPGVICLSVYSLGAVL